MSDPSHIPKDALLPCPFCGGEGRSGTIRYSDKMIREQGWSQDTFHFVNCIHCQVSNVGLTGYRTESLAAASWNRRVGS